MKSPLLHSKGRRAAAVILLMGVFYNTLLLAGGRGPFTLYESYWACQCGDSVEEIADFLETSDNAGAAPVLKGAESQLVHKRYTGLHSDICISPDSPLFEAAGALAETESGQNEICRKKLPLRYLSLIGSSYAFIYTAFINILEKPEFDTIVLCSIPSSALSGFRFSLIDPPRLS